MNQIDLTSPMFKDLIESMDNGVLLFDKNKQIIMANAAFRQIAEFKDNHFSLTNFFNLLQQEQKASVGLPIVQINKGVWEKIDFISSVEQVIQKAETSKFEEVAHNGRVYKIIIAPLKDHQKQVFAGLMLMYDITYMKEINRMKSEFLSVVAHQLRTPLGAMRWNAEMLLEGDLGDLPEPTKKTVEQIYESNKHMISLVNDLFNVSKIDQGVSQDKPVLTDIIKVIKEAISEIEPVAKEKSIEIKLSVEDGILFKIVIDSKRFREVIENLLSNAVKYNRYKGKVVVEVKRAGYSVQISVVDTGIGIPESDQQKVFSKFFRAVNAIKSETEGSGLGLFVAKSYVEAWGGKITFESKEGKGSTFIISLPLEPLKRIIDRKVVQNPYTQIKSNA